MAAVAADEPRARWPTTAAPVWRADSLSMLRLWSARCSVAGAPPNVGPPRLQFPTHHGVRGQARASGMLNEHQARTTLVGKSAVESAELRSTAPELHIRTSTGADLTQHMARRMALH